jgi:plasmid stability protein
MRKIKPNSLLYRLYACYDHAMSAIQVKDFPEDLHAKLRARAARQGRSVGGYVTEVLERDLSSPTTREWLDRLKLDPATDLTSEEIATSIHEGRAARDEQIRRAVTDRH